MKKNKNIIQKYCIFILKYYICPIKQSQLKQPTMKATLKINGQLIEAKKFSTLKAANNFKCKSQNREILFSKSGQYYVNI